MAALIHNNWKEFMNLYVGIPFLASIPLMIWWMSETPKFLLSKHKFSEAKAVLNRIATANRKKLPNFKFPDEISRSVSLDKEISLNAPSDDVSDTTSLA